MLFCLFHCDVQCTDGHDDDDDNMSMILHMMIKVNTYDRYPHAMHARFESVSRAQA
jgi:hypothetical protein